MYLLIDLKAAMPSLGPSLLHRFESKEGYREFDDVKPVREYYAIQ